MLILFDIDGTLLRTGGLGRRIMQQAGLNMLGREIAIDALRFAGRLDPLILSDLLSLNGVDPTDERIDEMRGHYTGLMTVALQESPEVQPLPGAHALVEQTAQIEGATLGVLTGNYEETGATKLTVTGWPIETFTVRVWGDESPLRPHSRDQLPGVAIERFGVSSGAPVSGERVVIIGDTVFDVACAKAHNCRVIGVATGGSSAAELHASGADLVVESLDDVRPVIDQIERWNGSAPARL